MFNCTPLSDCEVTVSQDTWTTETEYQETRSLFEIVAWSTVIIIIALLSITGNSAVITVVYMYEELRDQVSNILVVSLACTDLGCSCLAMFPTIIAVIADEWILGDFLCFMHCLCNYCFIAISLFTIMLISMDRTEAVVHSLHYASRVTRPRMITAVIIVWIFPWFWYSIPLFNEGWVSYNYWEANCGVDWGKPEVHWWVHCCVVFIFMPSFLAILIGSIIIMLSARKSNKNLQLPSHGIATVECQHQETKMKEKASNNEKLFKSLLVLILTFNLCMTPWVLNRVGKMLLGDLASLIIPNWMSTLATVCLYAASATNPYIYAIFRKDFRHAFQKLFRLLSSKVYPQ